MRIGICLPQLGPAAGMPLVTDFAVAAERAGFDSLWAEEHLMRPVHPLTGFGGIEGAPWPDHHRNALAPLALLAFVAGRTERVTLGTSILVVGYHHPLVLAKETATVDLLSGGRLALGLGVGWCEDEYQLLGSPFGQRGTLADEVLEVLDLSWSRGPFEYHGTHFTIPLCETSPAPADGRRVRMYGGFVSRAGWRRTARWCDVWQPYRLEPAEAMARLAEINALADSEFGRPPLEVSLRVLISPVDEPGPATGHPGRWIGDPDALAERVAEARDAGCHEIVLDPSFAPGSDTIQFWDELVDRLAPLVAASHGAG